VTHEPLPEDHAVPPDSAAPPAHHGHEDVAPAPPTAPKHAAVTTKKSHLGTWLAGVSLFALVGGIAWVLALLT
jgi:hypothetical protein